MGMRYKDFYIEMLGQECLEVAHRASKLKLFSESEIQEGQPLTNLERLNQEYNDLLAVVEELEQYGIKLHRDENLISAKKEKMRAMKFYIDFGVFPDKHTANCTQKHCHYDEVFCTMGKIK
jgi:hypothetical protein